MSDLKTGKKTGEKVSEVKSSETGFSETAGNRRKTLPHFIHAEQKQSQTQ